MRLRKSISYEKIPDIHVDEHQFYQNPDTIDELDLFSSHTLKNTPCPDKLSEKETNHAMENPQEIVIQLQPEASVPRRHQHLE